jgi:hypothetical protein
MAFYPSALAGDSLELIATTGVDGFALEDSTPTILSWTAPDDGDLHRFFVTSVLHVTSAETGGAIQLQWPLPDGTANTDSLYAGNLGAGIAVGPAAGIFMQPIEPGGTVNLVQLNALTAGAATLWAELWAL